MDYMLFIGGLALLIVGAERLVEAATALATRLGVTPLATGIVVVGLGTSMPELLTSLDAALRGSAGIAVGNVVGSNIANILLVLGLGALFLPVSCDPAPMRRDLIALLLGSALGLVALQQGTVGRWTGVALAAAMAAYLVVLLLTSRAAAGAEGGRPADAGGGHDDSGASALAASARAVVALAVLLAGAHGLVSGALGISERHGISETVVGLSIVALGTSLPELAVVVLALLRRRAEVAIGNIIGSTLFNLLGILGVTAIVAPLEVPDAVARFDAWIMLLAVLALALFARTGWRISRREGALLLAGYPVYLVALAA